MKKITFVSCLALFASFCVAQTTEPITFKVEDLHTNKIVPTAQISIKEAGWATKSTGADGKVIFENMPLGEIHYTVLKEGYQRLDGAVNVTTKGDDNNFLILLSKIPQKSEDKILITGEINDAKDRDLEGVMVEAKIANIIKTTTTDASGNYSLEMMLSDNPGGTKIYMEIKTKEGCKQKEAFDLPREVVIVKDFKLNCTGTTGVLDNKTTESVAVVDNACAIENFGSICFENKRSTTIKISVGTGIGYAGASPYVGQLLISPGQSACFQKVAARNYPYKIYITDKTKDGWAEGYNRVIQEAELMVEACLPTQIVVGR